MPETNIRCPECDARIKVIVSPGRASIPCPKCGATVPLKGRAAARDDEDEDDDRPARRSRSRDEDEDDEDDRPRARKRRNRFDEDDDEDDEEDRPRRRKKKRRQTEGDGPWPIAAGAAGLGFVLSFVGGLVVKGKAGLPEGEGGVGGMLCGLGFCLLMSLVLMVLGTVGVKNRTTYGRWGFQVTGTMGVVLGMVQAVFGGLLGGFAFYGLVFGLIHAR